MGRTWAFQYTLSASTKEKTVYPLPKPTTDDSDLGAHIRRTMALLATSTPARRNRVRILFYGQSITEQKWWRNVADDLRTRFPHADLVIENRAIGGFASPLLVRTAEHDLYPFYPDLLIFHVYGPEDKYEEIIAATRRRTTTEILLLSDHIATGQQSEKAAAWHDHHSSVWLPEIAARYGCGFVDIREPWKQYLKDNDLPASALLSDNVHLNERGNALMAELVKRHLRHDPERTAGPGKDLVRTYRVGTDVTWQGGRLRLPFEGNRVDVIAARPAGGKAVPARVRIDGKKPSEFPELYAITRPSATVGVGWPAILRVSWEKPLVMEDWTLRITETNDEATAFRFEVTGSKTGFDGAGASDRKFISDSGRVVIEPQDWHVARARQFTGKPMPVGFEVTWQVKAQLADVYEPPQVMEPAREYVTMLAQGLRNAQHTLEVIAGPEGEAPIAAVRVYRPPLK